MLRRGHRMALVLGCVIGIVTASVILRAREANFALPPVNERMLYLRSGQVADRLALSFDSILADVYWIRTIQHYGRDYKARARENRFELLYPLLDLTTTLDPDFNIAYTFGAHFLAPPPPEGPGRVDQAMALLEKGLKANPNRWQLARDAGYTHYLYSGDFAAAGAWFKRASTMPNAPAWLVHLAATTTATGGNRVSARQMLRELLGSEEAYIRKSAQRLLEQLDALDAMDELSGAVRFYRDRYGRNPNSWQDLASAGIIRGAVLDRYGVPYVLNPETGGVSLSKTSPLFPLPETLRSR